MSPQQIVIFGPFLTHCQNTCAVRKLHWVTDVAKCIYILLLTEHHEWIMKQYHKVTRRQLVQPRFPLPPAETNWSTPWYWVNHYWWCASQRFVLQFKPVSQFATRMPHILAEELLFQNCTLHPKTCNWQLRVGTVLLIIWCHCTAHITHAADLQRHALVAVLLCALVLLRETPWSTEPSTHQAPTIVKLSLSNQPFSTPAFPDMFAELRFVLMRFGGGSHGLLNPPHTKHH